MKPRISRHCVNTRPWSNLMGRCVSWIWGRARGAMYLTKADEQRKTAWRLCDE